MNVLYCLSAEPDIIFLVSQTNSSFFIFLICLTQNPIYLIIAFAIINSYYLVDYVFALDLEFAYLYLHVKAAHLYTLHFFNSLA